MLTAVPITTDSKDFKEIKHLYIAAFPKSERVPLRDLLRHDGTSEFVAGYDGETFCGFYSALTFGDITHILFLAIDERLRAHGYGSAMLDIVAAAHPHNRIIVDAEAEDPAASNNEQRIRRMAFYARNGYCRSGIAYIWRGVPYEILIRGGTITEQEFEGFWDNLDEEERKEM